MLRGCQPDILLITGMLSPYSTVVEKMYKELDKDKVTILKIERVGDVLAEAVSYIRVFLSLIISHPVSNKNFPKQTDEAGD